MVVKVGERGKWLMFIPSLRMSMGESSHQSRSHIPFALLFPVQRIEVPLRFSVPAKLLSRATGAVEVPS